MFFDGWEPIIRIIVVGLLSYIGLILVLRISGKRTLSKMNAFDLVVTVALGSILATIMLNKNVVLAEGMTAFLILVSLQYVIASLSVRSQHISNLVKSDPQLLFYNGQFLRDIMKTERVHEAEILHAVRSSGIASMVEVEAVILETDGSISVIQKSESDEASTLTNVKMQL